MVRFELETAMLDGSLHAADLHEAWNAQMQELLGITPPNATEGVLQDTHWSSGLIGYFPTYTVGNVLSVQLWESALREHPGIPDDIARNEFGDLLGWMRKHVHQYGRKLLPHELVQQATGQPLQAQPYLNYLRNKFGDIYGVSI
jgi:carboxypeptidase Taq